MLSRRRQEAASGVVWAGVSQAARVLIQIATLAVLSRLLPPTDFGLLAMATVVTIFATLLRDMGTAAAVIQREKLGSELLDTVFWFNVCLGGLASRSRFCSLPFRSQQLLESRLLQVSLPFWP